VAIAGRDQVRQEGVGAVDDAPQVDREQALERSSRARARPMPDAAPVMTATLDLTLRFVAMFDSG
jgi:hypothetical protein